MSKLIIFDLDGVITSEEAYWDTAGLTLHELLYSQRYWNVGAETGPYCPASTAVESRRISRATFPESEIMALKARAINSNWDTCYAAVCLHLIALLSLLPDITALFPLQPWDAGWLADFRRQFASIEVGIGQNVAATGKSEGGGPTPAFRLPFLSDSPTTPSTAAKSVFQGYVGLDLINRFDAYASEILGYPIEGVFSRYSSFWPFCQNIFQEWYLGDELYTRDYGHAPAQPGKPGCIHFEQPLLPVESVRTTLEMLRQQGYVLGFATGRSFEEAQIPLEIQGLLQYFDETHISTHDYVVSAEAELRANGDQTLLGKPHPFPFLIALDHDYHVGESQRKADDFMVVGDSTGDILGGRSAGALTVAVLTGARTPEARILLAESNPDFTINDVTELPALLAHIDSLATIQHLQFGEREKAERLLQRWFACHMNLRTESVTLTPKPVSLNSFNGFYRVDGQDFFFKTHVEEQASIQEYYHAELLHQAGYNIVMPLRTLHEEGQQMVIYPVVLWPVMFDLIRAIETVNADEVTIEMLAAAERGECERLLSIYQSTLASTTAEEHAQVPIHQLFWHRLVGGRLKSFYEGKIVPLPVGDGHSQEVPAHPQGLLQVGFLSTETIETTDTMDTTDTTETNVVPQGHLTREIGNHKEPLLRDTGRGVPLVSPGLPFNELLGYRWVINGVEMQHTLGELIERGRVVLNPARAAMTVIGHGDAHFGNVFMEDHSRYLYFDPAFAGRHTPLLDVVKPLFHNVFATWMYFPHEIARDLQLSVIVRDDTLYIEHNYVLTPVRQAILQTKVEHLLTPLIAWLRAEGGLPEDWLEMMKLALMCCPLLTINLIDGERIPPTVSWLGLSLAAQMGNSGIEPWRTEL